MLVRISVGNALLTTLSWCEFQAEVGIRRSCHMDAYLKQGSIPVGCVPPAFLVAGWVCPIPSHWMQIGDPPLPGCRHLEGRFPWMQTPRYRPLPQCRTPSLWMHTPHPLEADPPIQTPIGRPLPPVNRVKGVKALPCPKLHLRAVKIRNLIRH